MSKELPQQELDRGEVYNKLSVENENAGTEQQATTQQDAAEGNVDQGEAAPYAGEAIDVAADEQPEDNSEQQE